MQKKSQILQCVLFLFISLIVTHGGEPSLVDEIKARRVFSSPLIHIGTEPTPIESKALVKALDALQTGQTKAGMAALEEFLRAYPNTSWSPSLRVNMAEYYREIGRYTLALGHWEKAWETTKNSERPEVKSLAVRSFAGWTRLLASLGHTEKLDELFKELKELNLPLGTYSTKIEGTHDGLIGMKAKPGGGFRCGSYALANIADVLKLGDEVSRAMAQVDSPAGGFRVSQLLLLAKTNGFPVEAVRRPAGAEIVIPSVIHWQLNHYAAIVAKQDNRYKVMDPTFRGHVWMDSETIEAEASGVFLVPKENAPTEWLRLTAAESSSIYGKGGPNEIEDEDDDGPPCDPCAEDCEDEDEEDPPAANDGTGDGEMPPPCDDGSSSGNGGNNILPGDGFGILPGDGFGMPVWSVSEPYTTLWLRDTPLLYRRSNGKWMKLQLRYKHRGEDKGADIGGFGPNWECNLLGFIQANNATPDAYVNHKPGGGLVSFATNGTPDYKTQKQFVKLPVATGGGGGSGAILTGNVPVLMSPRNSRVQFQYFAPAGIGKTNYFPTHRIDRYGRTTLLNYETTGSLTRITNVVDFDGKAMVLAYTNTSYPNRITSVTDPYGRSAHFRYDSSGRLTNITDMAGMQSSFEYDGSDRITKLITPYGTNNFEYLTGTSSTYGGTLRRGLRITEPTGVKQFYSYCDSGLEGWRNSYHWNRAQYDAISATGKANVLDMPDGDYQIASVKNWLHGLGNQNGYTVSDTLGSFAGPASGGTRAYTYLYYPGSGLYIGSQKRIASVYTPLGDAFNIQRNDYGRPTVLTYYKAGQTATYSNFFDISGRRLERIIGPRGERVRGYGYHSGFTNLLTSVTNALDEVVNYTHDTNGLKMKLTSIRFPSGLVRSNLYYASGANAGFRSAQMDVGFRTNYFGYQNGNLAAHTNELGLVTAHLYDNLNRLVSTAYPDGTTISNVFDKLDLIGVKDRLNQWTRYGYNSLRQVVAITNANGQITTYDYCDCGSPSSITRWNGGTPLTTLLNYDLAGNLTNVLHPDGYQVAYTYTAGHLRETATDNGGHQLWLFHTQLGARTAVYRADIGSYGNTAFSHTFDEYGRITQAVDRNSVTVTNAYDVLGRLVARRSIGSTGYPDETGLETFGYNASGLFAFTNALGFVTRYERDAAGRLLCETNANDEVLTFAYNAADQLLTLTDGKGQMTRWNYDTYGRVTNKVDALNATILRYAYDANGQLTNRWTAAKGDTFYGYDSMGNLTNVDYPGTLMDVTLRYDALGRLTNVLDAIGSTRFAYSATGQLTSEDGPWGDDAVVYTLTARQRTGLALAQPSTGAWTQNYGYDTVGRLTSVSSPVGEFGYSYTGGADNRDQYLSLAGGAQVYRTFDSLGRLVQSALYSPSYLRNSHSYQYNEGSQRTQQTFSDGVSAYEYSFTDYTYDKIGQLKMANGTDHALDYDIYDYVDTPRQHEQFGYAYDAAWNLVTKTNNALVQAFTVNNLNELTNVTRSGTLTVAGTATERRGGPLGYPQGVTNVTVSGTGLSSGAAEIYADGSWARTNASPATSGASTYTAVGQDTYGRRDTNSVSVTLPSSLAFRYDANGNLTNDSVRVFEYDAENQLTNVYVPGAWRSAFQYDAFGRRRVRSEYTWQSSAWTLTSEVRYVYDGMLVIQERDANNTPVVSYTRGNDLSGTLQGAGGIGGLLARTDMSLHRVGDGTAHALYHADGNGNITCLMQTNGLVVARYSYEPFGRLLTMNGPLAEANSYRFSSKEWHEYSGLYYYGYRFYAADLQRWLNRDPLGDIASLQVIFPYDSDDFSTLGETVTADEDFNLWTRLNRNLYAALGNNLIARIDPLGLADTCPSLPPFQPIEKPTRDALSKYFQDKNPEHIKDIKSDELKKARDNADRAVKKHELDKRVDDKYRDIQERRRDMLDKELRRRTPRPPFPWKDIWQPILSIPLRGPIIFMGPWQDPYYCRDNMA